MAKMRQPLENPVMCGETWQHCDGMERTFVEFKDFLQFTARRFKVLAKAFPKKSEAGKAINEAIERFKAAHLFFYREGISKPEEFYDKSTRIHGLKPIINRKNKLIGV